MYSLIHNGRIDLSVNEPLQRIEGARIIRLQGIPVNNKPSNLAATVCYDRESVGIDYVNRAEHIYSLLEDLTANNEFQVDFEANPRIVDAFHFMIWDDKIMIVDRTRELSHLIGIDPRVEQIALDYIVRGNSLGDAYSQLRQIKTNRQ